MNVKNSDLMVGLPTMEELELARLGDEFVDESPPRTPKRRRKVAPNAALVIRLAGPTCESDPILCNRSASVASVIAR